jgi:hypothetical protein
MEFATGVNNRDTSRKLAVLHFAVATKGELYRLGMGLQSRGTTQNRGDFVAPDRNTKSPAFLREYREPTCLMRKGSPGKGFGHLAVHDTNVGSGPDPISMRGVKVKASDVKAMPGPGEIVTLLKARSVVVTSQALTPKQARWNN